MAICVDLGRQGKMRKVAGVLLLAVAACSGREPEWQPPAGSFVADSAELQQDNPPVSRRVARVVVTPAFLDSLPVMPLLGRKLMREDPGTAMISERLWRSVLAARPEVIGTSITLAGDTVIIVGVMPPGFEAPGGADIWVASE
jgi:hypothetical protein